MREAPRPSEVPAETTASLVHRAQSGDAAAQDLLFARCLPLLRRWARGRLPLGARDLVDTFDIVQEAALSTLRNMRGFAPERRGAFMAYLREAVNSKIKDHLRRVRRHPAPVSLPPQQAAVAVSPLEHAMGQEQVDRYEAALKRLSDMDRAVIVARVELQQSYDEIGQALGKPGANAARSAFIRALDRLVREIDDGQ